jgi:hypothetical protein
MLECFKVSQVPISFGALSAHSIFAMEFASTRLQPSWDEKKLNATREYLKIISVFEAGPKLNSGTMSVPINVAGWKPGKYDLERETGLEPATSTLGSCTRVFTLNYRFRY